MDLKNVIQFPAISFFFISIIQENTQRYFSGCDIGNRPKELNRIW